MLVAGYDAQWRPAARHACLTGTVQLGGVWLRLWQTTGDPRWLNAGLKAVEQAARAPGARTAAGDPRRAGGLVPGLGPLRAAPVPELGGEVPRGLAHAPRGLPGARRRERRPRLALPAGRHARVEAHRGRRAARRRGPARRPLQPRVADRPGGGGTARGGRRGAAALSLAATRSGRRKRPRRRLPTGRRSAASTSSASRRLRDAARSTRTTPDLRDPASARTSCPPQLLAAPRLGTINAHYGLLPAYRGMNVTEWSVLRGDPPGVTVHLVDSGVDTGDRSCCARRSRCGRATPSRRFAQRHQEVAARLLVRAALELRDGTAKPLPQRADEGRQYYRMHPALRRLAADRLRAQAAERTALTGARSG